MQQQLDLRDRQLIEANRAKADLLVPSLCSAVFRLYVTYTISNRRFCGYCCPFMSFSDKHLTQKMTFFDVLITVLDAVVNA